MQQENPTPEVLPRTSMGASSNNHYFAAGDLYWTEIDTSILPAPIRSDRSARVHREQLESLFEEDLPCPLTEVHAVFAAIGDGRVIGCAAPLRALEPLRVTATTATPSEIPCGISADAEPIRERLNLLTGSYEPFEIQSRRRRLAVGVAMCWLVMMLSLLIGAQRRVEALGSAAENEQRRAMATMQAAVGDQASATRQPLVALFQSELNRARLTSNETETTVEGKHDLLAQFDAIARAWPEQPARRVRRIELLPQRIAISAATDSVEDAQAFAEAFRALPGWRFGIPSVTASTGETLVQFELRPLPPAEMIVP